MIVSDLPDTGFLSEAERLAEPEVDLRAVGLGAQHVRQAAPEGDIPADRQLLVFDIAFDRPLPGIEPALQASLILALILQRRRQG